MASFEDLSEHYGYVADRVRMDALRRAVPAVVRPGDRVVDLGCGTGILGHLAFEAGAAHVTFIDRSGMIEVARRVMTDAGLADRATFIGTSSLVATVEPRADVILSDNVGYLGIDYDVLETLKDAAERFLAPGGRLLPQRLRLFAALASRSGNDGPVARWQGDGVPGAFGAISDVAASIKTPVTLEAGEVVSEPVQVAAFALGEDAPAFVPVKASLVPSRDAEVDGIVGWFEADLADGITVTNSPLAALRLDRPSALLPVYPAVSVRAGEALDVSIMARPADHLWAWKLLRGGETLAARTTLSTLSAGAGARPGTPLVQTAAGRLHALVLGYCDGTRTAAEIEAIMLDRHGALRPTEAALKAEVAAILRHHAEPAAGGDRA